MDESGFRPCLPWRRELPLDSEDGLLLREERRTCRLDLFGLLSPSEAEEDDEDSGSGGPPPGAAKPGFLLALSAFSSTGSGRDNPFPMRVQAKL